eukprot:1378936-Amorphochlora_amoeboformis.AAC.1
MDWKAVKTQVMNQSRKFMRYKALTAHSRRRSLCASGISLYIQESIRFYTTIKYNSTHGTVNSADCSLRHADPKRTEGGITLKPRDQGLYHMKHRAASRYALAFQQI